MWSKIDQIFFKDSNVVLLLSPKSACVRLEAVRVIKLIHDSCILTCQNTNTSLTMHIADFQRKEIKNDDFLPT